MFHTYIFAYIEYIISSYHHTSYNGAGTEGVNYLCIPNQGVTHSLATLLIVEKQQLYYTLPVHNTRNTQKQPVANIITAKPRYTTAAAAAQRLPIHRLPYAVAFCSIAVTVLLLHPCA